ncbi:MAG TPA: hypothetical protein VLE70_01775, partial [Anaerolineae bacterium]|nr:hypothetical protein [Anaerolineae bacterium]
MQAKLTGIRQNFTDFRQRWSQVKLKKSHVFWIVIGAIILTMILGFTRGGWTTGGTALKMSEASSQSAVVERLASICVAQFNADGQRAGRLEELKGISSYQRAGYVKDQGWA